MRLNRVSKVAIGVAAAYGIYSALGWWALPSGLKWAASGPVSNLLGRQLSIGEVRFNPWTVELTARDIRLSGRSEADKPVTIGSLYANVAALSSITRFGVVLDALSVDHLSGALSVDENGVTNFQDVIDSIHKRFPPQPEKPGEEPFRFSLNNVRLSNSDFRISIPSHGVDEQITEINLGIPFIGSIGSDRNINVLPELRLKANGSAFEAHGRSLPFKDTRATQMHFDLKDYSLPHLARMLPLNAAVSGGSVTAAADVTFAQGTAKTPGTILIDFSAEAKDFAMALKGAPAANSIAFSSLKVDSAEIDLINRRAEVKSVSLESPTVRMQRLADGSLAWSGLIKTASAKAGEKPEEAAAAGSAQAPEAEKKKDGSEFAWVVRSAALEGGRFLLEDQAAHGARIDAESLTAAATNITMKEGETTPFEVSARLLGGSLRANGGIELGALRGKAAVDAQRLALGKLSGYAQSAGWSLDGQATLKTNLDFDLSSEPLSVHAQGDLGLKKAALAQNGGSSLDIRLESARAGQFDAAYKKDLSLKFAKLDLGDGHFALPESGFSVDTSAAARSLELGWAAESGRLDLNARSLALTTPELKAGTFEGRLEKLNAESLRVGWDGKTENAAVSGMKLSAEGTSLKAGSFSGTARGSDAQNLSVLWKGKARTLGVNAKAASVSGGAFSASPVQGGTDRIGLEGLRIAVDTNPNGAVDVGVERVSSQPSHIEVAGDTPVKASLSSLTVSGSAFRLADRITFSAPDISADGVKSTVDLFDFNAEHAALRGAAFEKAAETSFRLDSADLAKAQAISPVNAARVSTLSDTLAVRKFDWQSGTAGHLTLESAAARSSAFQIEGGGARFGRVALASVTGVNAPASGTVNIGRIAIEKPRYSISRDAKGNLDIDPLLGKRGSAEKAKKTREEIKKKVAAEEKRVGRQPNQPVRVGEFSIRDGGFAFIDKVVRPAGQFRFGSLNVSVKPVVYGGDNTPSTLTASALINGSSKLSITGSGSPFVDKGKLTAKGTLTAVSMPFFTPYSVHYVSYPIQKGNLSVKSDITMTDKTKIKADNHVVIEQLGWGPYIPNETSISLPVTLATSLLTDGKGNIDFELPISGDLADPQFSLSDLVLTGLKNLIIKVVASPVNLLASLANFSTSSSSKPVLVPFLSGQSRLTADQQSTVTQIVKALKEHPEAKLEITPLINQSGDSEALHQRTYNGLLKVAQSTMPEKERSREAAVRALFSMQFPKEDPKGLSVSEMESRLYKAVAPDRSNIGQLADARCRHIARAVSEAGIKENRIFITGPEFDKKSTVGGVKLRFVR
ncbi:DUF748 domain-containing protein [Mesosutterella sp. AGMB02718]|uniref:DUF748 domain-containing protein n=1 Tax=Mesosutterella faecium TaxID=2925194 RepID=A0ABT7IJM3_9BURK|nr:DUF748 domain-containing protein [Mesosutterella sp. AGMB02718]MDL2058564.1 DUF748 domain-containing protein [Mesosutterella sp. AGMB02718]